MYIEKKNQIGDAKLYSQTMNTMHTTLFAITSLHRKEWTDGAYMKHSQSASSPLAYRCSHVYSLSFVKATIDRDKPTSASGTVTCKTLRRKSDDFSGLLLEIAGGLYSCCLGRVELSIKPIQYLCMRASASLLCPTSWKSNVASLPEIRMHAY